jgi:hypothetical protein
VSQFFSIKLKSQVIIAKPKANIGDKVKQQAYLNGMVDSGTIEPTSLMNTHVKGH